MEIVISPRLARGLSLLSAYQKPPRKNVVANFNFIANFADARRLSFVLHRYINPIPQMTTSAVRVTSVSIVIP